MLVDTQKVIARAEAVEENAGSHGYAVELDEVSDALTLYLDAVNLSMRVIELLQRRDQD